MTNTTDSRPAHVFFSCRIPEEMLDELHLIKDRDGIPIAEQVRRALLLWFGDSAARQHWMAKAKKGKK
jgi:hypothetical protein